MREGKLLIIIGSLVVLLTMSLVIEIKKIKDEEIIDKEYIAYQSDYNISKTVTEKEIIYEVKDKDLTYSWTFLKNDKTRALKDKIEIDTNLKLDVIKDVQNLDITNKVDNNDLLIVKFEHHGDLPSKAKITIDVKDKYKNGDILYLYYLNEEEDQIEYIDSGLIVENGKVTFEIEHCSNYFLTGSIVQDAVNNPKNINLIIIVMVIVIIVLIASTLFQNKKK